MYCYINCRINRVKRTSVQVNGTADESCRWRSEQKIRTGKRVLRFELQKTPLPTLLLLSFRAWEEEEKKQKGLSTHSLLPNCATAREKLWLKTGTLCVQEKPRTFFEHFFCFLCSKQHLVQPEELFCFKVQKYSQLDIW